MMYLQQHVIIIDHGFQIPSPTHVQLLNLLVKCMCIINEYELSQWLVLKSIGNSSFLLVLDLNTTIAAVVSSVAAILISSIFFLCVGCICGRRHHQQKLVESGGISDKKSACTQVQPIPVPMYEELQSTSDQVKAFELIMKENVAYGPTLHIEQ